MVVHVHYDNDVEGGTTAVVRELMDVCVTSNLW
jgi:hypothetical protein